MEDWIHSYQMEIRDSDCDAQGVVANHVYLALFAHARHQFFEALGYDLKGLHEQGIDAFIARAECDYKKPLFSCDRVTIHSGLYFKGHVRAMFQQKMVRDSDGEICAEALFTGVAVDKDGFHEPVELVAAKEAYLKKIGQ